MNLKSENQILFTESLTPIAYLDSNGFFKKVNSAYCLLFSFLEEDLLGKAFTIHYPNLNFESKQKIIQNYKEFFLHGKKESYQDTFADKNKIGKKIEITRTLVRLESEEILAVILLTVLPEQEMSSEKILNSIFNAIGGVIYHNRIDSNGNRKMIFMSERADTFFGYSSQEIQANVNLLANVIHPDDMISPSQSLEIFKKNNNFRRIQYRVKNKSGGYRWLEERSILFSSPINEFDIYGVITDISETKENTKRLEDLRFALDQSVNVTITDANGVIIDCNENFCKVSGYDRGKLIGKNHRIINSGYHPKEFFKNMWDTISSGKVWQGEIKNMRSDGKYYWVYSYIIPLLDDSGIPFQYISIRNDITNRKEAEELLAASEEKYRLLYENAPIGIQIIDLNSNILDCNTYLLNMLGYSKEELVGKKSYSFIHEDFIEYRNSALSKLKSGEIKRFYIEEKRRTKEGLYIWVGCYSNAVTDYFGKVIYRLDFVTDIENRKKTEEQLLKQDQAKNAILNIVAHDLRSPIVGITNLARLLYKLESSEDKQNYLHLMENSGNHALNIILDLIDMESIEHEKQFSDLESTELNCFIKDCIKMHEIQYQDKKIQIHFKSSVEKIYHDINQDKMMRVFSNLLSNAIKFSFENSKVEIFLNRKNGKTIIEIKDYGMGIPKELHGIIFDKFSQARRVGTKGEKTIGLGLSIVKEIIDKHHGKIRVESEENKGTSFFIEL